MDPFSQRLIDSARSEGPLMTRMKTKLPHKAKSRKISPGKNRKAIPRTKAEQRAETLEQILDAAEYLFSKHGLYGVTLRDVAQQIGVHTSLMHYYFDDKFALFTEVFERRAAVTSDRRMKALDQYEKDAKGKPTVAGALHAFLDTDFDLYMNGGDGWKNYGAFGSQLSNTPEGATMFDRHFDPVVLRLIGILKKALPGVLDRDIFWGYHFVTGSFMHSLSRSGRLDRLSSGLCKSNDLEAIKERMADFMAAGFASLRKR
jgi:AcrR family transcriptional regulator